MPLRPNDKSTNQCNKIVKLSTDKPALSKGIPSFYRHLEITGDKTRSSCQVKGKINNLISCKEKNCKKVTEIVILMTVFIA